MTKLEKYRLLTKTDLTVLKALGPKSTGARIAQRTGLTHDTVLVCLDRLVALDLVHTRASK